MAQYDMHIIRNIDVLEVRFDVQIGIFAKLPKLHELNSPPLGINYVSDNVYVAIMTFNGPNFCIVKSLKNIVIQ